MIPILYSSSETNFTANGIGWLSDCSNCIATEALNGVYECEFSYPITGRLYSEIFPDRIIKAKPSETSNPQLFKIYRSTKPINGIVKFYCQHISYNLNGNPVSPFSITSATNATAALSAILSHCHYAHSFTAVSTSSVQSRFELKTPASARKCLGGMEGSVLDNFGGEYEFDNFVIKHYSQRGADNGVTIEYGKNLTAVTADTNISGVYTSVYPYAIDADGGYHELPEKIIELQTASSYGEPRTLTLDMSDKFKDEEITETKLRQYTSAYITANHPDSIAQNVKISFVQLWQSPEYKSLAALERISLGDSVTIKYVALNLLVKARAIKTVYDVLKEKYTEIELGKAKSNFASSLQKISSDVKTMSDFVRNQPSVMEKAIKDATDLITGQDGGYVVINSGNNGKPKEILIMNDEDINVASRVWRWNLGGLGYSSTGYSGSYGTAIRMDGAINASFITTGVLNADLITAGTIKDSNDNFNINLSSGHITLGNGASDSYADLWQAGVTLYHSDNSVATSMFVSSTDAGVVTAEIVLVGERDNEKVKAYIDNGSGIVETDKIHFANSVIEETNGKIKVSGAGAIVCPVSLEDNGSEVGSFYVNIDGESILKTSAIFVNRVFVNRDEYAPINVTINGTNYTVLAKV